MRLIVAPHADDESFGCGGLMAKYPGDCAVVVVAQSSVTRWSEFEKAMSILGVDDFTQLDFPDGAVGDDPTALVTALDGLLDDWQPDELYLPWPGTHQDHIAVYEAGMRTARLSMSRQHWYPPTVMVYDCPAYDLDLYEVGMRWNVFESLTLDQASAKAAAVGAYESESTPGCHPSNGVLGQAAVLGQARGVEFAEQYALVRSVRA